MTKQTQALKLALEWDEKRKYIMPYMVRDAIREALAEESSGTEQPDMNLSCKSVQARLATSWGYVKAEQPAQQHEACEMGELCIGCSPRNVDGSCPGEKPNGACGCYVEGFNDGMKELEQPAHQCKWPTCQSEEYQQTLAKEIERELVGEQPAQPQQEPVAKYTGEVYRCPMVNLYQNIPVGTLLYTAPPAQTECQKCSRKKD